MGAKWLLASVAVVGLMTGPVLAQTAGRAAPPVATVPPGAGALQGVPAPRAVPSAPAATPSAPAASVAGAPVNLNTATAAQLDALPSVGKARAKAIMDERAKRPFASWADFDTRMKGTSVNAGVKAKIKDRVTF